MSYCGGLPGQCQGYQDQHRTALTMHAAWLKDALHAYVRWCFAQQQVAAIQVRESCAHVGKPSYRVSFPRVDQRIYIPLLHGLILFGRSYRLIMWCHPLKVLLSICLVSDALALQRLTPTHSHGVELSRSSKNAHLHRRSPARRRQRLNYLFGGYTWTYTPMYVTPGNSVATTTALLRVDR